MSGARRQSQPGSFLTVGVVSHVLHISDCHLVAAGTDLIGVDTQASLEAVLEQALTEQNPDAVIASGDLAHDPLPQVYRRFVETIRRFTAAPLLCLPGNHDVLGAMQNAQMPLAPLTVGAWHLVPLDSHEDDAPRALITADDKAAIAAHLAAASTEHCLVATHHPPVAVNCPWLDKDRIQKPEELLEWLSERSAQGGTARLRGVVFGHTHQAVDDFCGDVPVFGSPSTCFQFAPNSTSFTIDDQSPGYRWLELSEDGGVVSRVRRVDSFPIQVQLK